MDNLIRIALLQLAWSRDVVSTMAQIETLVSEASRKRATLICLPELSILPYFPGTRDSKGYDFAEPVIGSSSERFFSNLARTFSVTMVSSMYEDENGILYNTALIHAPNGELLGRTRKIHIPSGKGYHETDFYGGGDKFPVFNIGTVTVATPTCYDQWFPELARIYSLNGAELIIYPSIIGQEPTDTNMDTQGAWETVIRSHAIANGIFVAAINRVGTENGVTFFGSSFVCDPSGEVLAKASRERTEVIFADLEPKAIAHWREHFPLLHQRRPETYGRLLDKWLGDKPPTWLEKTPINFKKPRANTPK